MTSSSERELWTPLRLTSLAPGLPFGGLSLVPPAQREQAGRGSEQAWLPSLASEADHAHELQHAEAFRRGRDEATSTERARADERCRTALQAVARVAAHLESIAEEFARDRERDLQGMAVAMARKILQHELTTAPERVGELVTRAIELMPLDHTLDVRLNPDDLATLGSTLEALTPPGRKVLLQWIGDARIECGGFIVESPQRIIDGRADVALRALYERFDHD